MLRRLAPLAPLALLALLTCQDYRFNPVGRCTIQPGQARVSISGISTADVLFVIDDSASMAPIQASLAANFQSFIQQVATIQAAEVAAGRPPLDLYLAITSSAVVVNRGLAGVNCSSGGSCSITNPTFPPAYSYACSPAGSTCADIIDKFYAVGSCSVTTTQACATGSDCPGGETCNQSGCTALGLAPSRGSPFFAGDFVARGSNPKVLAFTGTPDQWSTWQTDPTIQGLIARFGENIQVGDCGANQEMHLQAGRLAVEKALAGQQGAGVTWPHPDAKLVVVFVGNEDDCSTKRADQGGVVWAGGSGNDTCENQAQLPPAGSALYPVADYASFFTHLNRPLGAAFIRPGDAGCNCTDFLSCTTNGYGNGTRFKALASAFRGQGVDVVEASVCGAFGQALADIAKLVKPLQPLTLPTQPAAGVVTQLRLVGSDGKTAYVCSGPSIGPSTGSDWWFVDCDTQAATPGTCSATPSTACFIDQDCPSGETCQPGTSLCIGLGACSTTARACTGDGGCPSGETCLLRSCIPTPGQQILVAEYLGRVPKDGCSVGTAGGPSTECATKLTGKTGSELVAEAERWSCDATGGQVGTCLCRPGQ